MSKLKKIFLCLVMATLSIPAFAAETGKVSVLEHWVGPGNHDRVFTDGDVSALGGGCKKTKAFAIKTSDPNYKAMNGMILAAIMAGKQLILWGPGNECLGGEGDYPVVTRVSVVR